MTRFMLRPGEALLGAVGVGVMAIVSVAQVLVEAEIVWLALVWGAVVAMAHETVFAWGEKLAASRGQLGSFRVGVAVVGGLMALGLVQLALLFKAMGN